MSVLRSTKSISFITAALLVLGASASCKTVGPKEKPLFDRLGGLRPLSIVVDDFVDAMLRDEVLNQNPAIKEGDARVAVPYLKYTFTTFLCQATGGPCQSSLRRGPGGGGHVRSHSGAEFDRMTQLFKQSLDKSRVPEREQQELFAILGTTRAEIVMGH